MRLLHVHLVPCFGIHVGRKPLLLQIHEVLEECTSLVVVYVVDSSANPLLLLRLVPAKRRVLKLDLHLLELLETHLVRICP